MKNNKQENSAHNLALMRGLAKLKSMQQRQEQEQADAIEAHLLATKISLKAPAKAQAPATALRKVTTSLNLEEMESLHKAQDSAIDANTISYQESANKQSIERAASLLKKANSRNHNESSAPSALAVSALKKQPQISATPELSASFVDSQSQHLKDTNTVIADGDSAHAWPLNEDPLSSTTATPTTTTTSANLAALNATLASQANADIDADADAPTNDSANTHKTNNSTSTEVKEAKANTKTSSSNSETVKSKTKSITKAKAARLNPKDKELHITSGQEHNLSHAQNAQDTTTSAKVLYSASSMQEPNNLDALELNNATMSANVTLDNNQALSIKATSELISAPQKVAHSQAPAPSATPKVEPVAANSSDHQNKDTLPEAPINSAQIAQSSADNSTTESLPEDMTSSSSASSNQKEAETAQESVTVTDPVIEAIAEPLADNTSSVSLPDDMASSSRANREQKDTETALESVTVTTPVIEAIAEPVADNTSTESLPENMASSSTANSQKETENALESVTVTDPVIKAIAEPVADNTTSESLPEDMASSSTANKEQKETETAQESVTVTDPVIEAIADPLADNTTTESLPEDMVSSSTANKEQKETETALESVTVTDTVIEAIAEPVADNTTSESLPEDMASSSSANREQETEVAAVQENSKDVLKGDKESRTKTKSTKSSLGNSASTGAEEQIASEVKPKAKAKGKKGGNAYARNYSEFVRLFGSSSASIKERTVSLIEHVFQAESEILGERYEYTLKDHELFCLEQNLFGSGLNLADTGVDKQVSLLELLLVLLSQNQNVLEHRHVSNSSEVKYSFIKRQALTLRRIVFNNPMVERINTSQGTDDEKWLSWQRDFNEFNQKSDANFKLDTNHYHLLKRAFHNFDNFTKAITLLRSWAIVPNKAKAWTEHFLFPFGAESLYYDTTDMLAKGASNHCTNFGQLLFTMLMRAHPKSTPDQQNALLMLCDCFFEQHEGFNVFAQLLGDSFSSGEDEIIAHLRSQLPEDSNSADQSWSSCSNVFKQASQNLLQKCEFVPYKEHRCFDQLEEDFRQLLSLNLTKQQLLKSLSVMGMLNILIYFLEQEQRLASINNSKNVPNIDLVLSLGNKASPRVAKLSLDRLQANDKLHSIALNNFITQRLYLLIRCCVSYFKEDLKLDPKEQDLVCNLTRVAFNFVTHKAITIDLNGKGSIYVQDNISSKELASSHKKAHNPLNRLQESQPYPSYKNVLNTISNALMTHTGNNKSPHRDLAIEIGLISGTQKAHQYYSFSDELLRTLVLCCVDKNKSMIMLSEFLQKLYDRYHIVIGPQQAHYYYSSNTQGRSNHIEEKEFKKNLNELIAQLKRMDLLINLSDSCEYVTNPFSIHS